MTDWKWLQEVYEHEKSANEYRGKAWSKMPISAASIQLLCEVSTQQSANIRRLIACIKTMKEALEYYAIYSPEKYQFGGGPADALRALAQVEKILKGEG